MKKENKNNEETIQDTRPSTTIEGRENQMINLAVNLAEKQLREGTASSQLICHYLKLGSTRERIEKEILEKQARLLAVKADSIEKNDNLENIYLEAIEAMKTYSGQK